MTPLALESTPDTTPQHTYPVCLRTHLVCCVLKAHPVPDKATQRHTHFVRDPLRDRDRRHAPRLRAHHLQDRGGAGAASVCACMTALLKYLSLPAACVICMCAVLQQLIVELTWPAHAADALFPHLPGTRLLSSRLRAGTLVSVWSCRSLFLRQQPPWHDFLRGTAAPGGPALLAAGRYGPACAVCCAGAEHLGVVVVLLLLQERLAVCWCRS
jgi:hypothetical protein